MGRRRQAWSVGSVFTVALKDGQHALGQVISYEPEVLNSVGVALFDSRVPTREDALVGEPALANAFAILFATRDLLDSGVWQVSGDRAVAIPKRLFPYEHLRATGFIGARVIGSGIITEFLNAFYALAPWDDWHDPQYLDRLLLSPAKKPQRLVYKNSA